MKVKTVLNEWVRDSLQLTTQNYRRLALIAIAVLAIYGVSLWAAVSSALDVVSSFNISDVANAGQTIDESVDVAYEKLDSIAEATGKVRRVATPVFAFCGLGRLVPPIRENCDAAYDLFDRFEHDRDGAVSLMSAAQSVDQLVASLRSEESDSDEVDFESSIKNIRLELTRFDSAMVEATALQPPDSSLLLPQFETAYSRADTAERELRQLAIFVRTGVDVLESAQNLRKTAGTAFNNLSSGSGSASALRDIAETLTQLEPSVLEFRNELGRFESAMPSYFAGSSIQNTVLSMVDDASLIIDLVLGIAKPIEILDESIANVSGSNKPLLASGEILAILNKLIDHRDELSEASASLQRVHSRLNDGSGFRQLLGSEVAEKLDRILSDYSGLVGALDDTPTVLKALLGGDGKKRYLVLGQSSDEIRPAGGFTSSVWTMTLENGALTDIAFDDVRQFGERVILDQLPTAPNELSTHMDARGWYLRDVGWSPDFRSVAETVILMNTTVGREPIDGVISLTQWGFVYLVDGLGSIETPEGRLTGSNVMAAIENGTDEYRSTYLRTLLDSIIDSLTVGQFKTNFTHLARSVLRSFDEKQIMFYAVDDELQAQIEDIGWSGSLDVTEGDTLGVFDSNVGWNKVGRNIARTVEYRVDLNTDGSASSSLSIDYQNNSRPSQGACGEQAEPTPGENRYDALKNACYWDLIRVYTPFGAMPTSLPALPAPESSVAVRSGKLTAGENTAGVFFDQVGQYFGGLVVVPPKSSITVVFEYELPVGTVEKTGNKLEYLLTVPIEAGIPSSGLRLEITFPDGYRIIESSAGSNSIDSNVVRIDQILDSDFTLRIVAEQVG